MKISPSHFHSVKRPRHLSNMADILETPTSVITVENHENGEENGKDVHPLAAAMDDEEEEIISVCQLMFFVHPCLYCSLSDDQDNADIMTSFYESLTSLHRIHS